MVWLVVVGVQMHDEGLEREEKEREKGRERRGEREREKGKDRKKEDIIEKNW